MASFIIFRRGKPGSLRRVRARPRLSIKMPEAKITGHDAMCHCAADECISTFMSTGPFHGLMAMEGLAN